MKRLDIAQKLSEQINEESRVTTRIMLIEKQLDGLEKLIEGSAADVKDPGAYNTVAGFISQLRFHCAAVYRTPEHNVDIINADAEQWPPRPHPLANFAEQVKGEQKT